MKKYIAEVLGTFALTFAVALSLSGSFPVPTPLVAGLVLGLFVYSIEHISGTHINPAVTIGIWSIKKINNKDAVFYIISQFIGAAIALYAAALIGISAESSGVIVLDTMKIGIAELLGTFFFTFGIASVVYGKTPKDFSGAVVGGSLLLGIIFSALIGSNGVLNPAVALGIGSFGIMYVIGPVLGSLLGFQFYKYLI